MPRLLLLAAALFTTHAAPPPIRVLFIGNSLTAQNGLPSMLEALGKANGRPIDTTTIAFPNYSLEDHWQHGEARRAIARGDWTVVVLQQGPSALPDSRALLVDYARRFSDEAARAGSKTALRMVWPSRARIPDFDGVKLSYQSAARDIGGVFLPAGEAWRIAWRQNPDLQLYGPDGFHPSPLGSALAALVIFEALTGSPPARLPRWRIADPDLAILRAAASQALENR